MNKSTIDEIALNNHLEKLICLQKMQQEDIQNLNNKFSTIINYYKTDNTNKILELNNIEKANLKIISEDSKKYINIINNTISKYKQTELQISNTFENITKE